MPPLRGWGWGWEHELDSPTAKSRFLTGALRRFGTTGFKKGAAFRRG